MSKKISSIGILLLLIVPAFSQVLGTFPDHGWLTTTPLPAGRWANGITSYRSGPLPNDTAYLVVVSGGDASFANTALTTRLNTTSNVWTSLANIPVSRTQAQAYYYNGQVFFIGGYGASFAPVNTVSIYTTVSNSWSTGAVMPTAVGDYAGCQYNDSLIYIIGGYTGSGDTKTVQVYNAKSNTWSIATIFAGTAVAGARAGIAITLLLLADIARC